MTKAKMISKLLESAIELEQDGHNDLAKSLREIAFALAEEMS